MPSQDKLFKEDFSQCIQQDKSIIRIATFLYMILFCLSISPIKSEAATKDKQSVNEQVKSLLSKMTLVEKIGQMTQLTIQVVSITQGPAQQRWKLDMKRLEEATLK